MICVRDESDDERLLSLEEFEQAARRGEMSPFTWVKHAALTGDRFIQARELPLFVSVYDPRRIHFQHHFQLGRLPVVTLLMAFLFVGAYLFVADEPGGDVSRELLLRWGAKTKSRLIENGELWRLWSANLLHTDYLHLFFNLFAFVTTGAVVEGVYRRGDYLAILFYSGIGSMLVSALLNDGVTVGASGMIFGCIGTALAFGFRFRSLLPRRYRWLFGGILVSYALLMFFSGLQNPDTDNAGHVGGIVIGFAFGGLLTPRLLRLVQVHEKWKLVLRPYLFTCIGLLLLFLPLEKVTRAIWLKWQSSLVHESGLVITYPVHWRRVSTGLPGERRGFVTFGNGADAFVAAACEEWWFPRSPEIASRDFVREQLTALAQQKQIARLRVEPSVAASLNPTLAVYGGTRTDFSFVGKQGEIRARAWIFIRGHVECVFVAATHVGADATSNRMLDDIRARLNVRPSEELQRAAGRVRGVPSVEGFWTLARAAERIGAYEQAADAYAQALRWMTPTDLSQKRQLLFEKARFEWLFLRDLSAAEQSEAALRGTWIDVDGNVTPPSWPHRLLGADILLEQKRWGEAATKIAELQRLWGDNEALRKRQDVLYLRANWPLPQLRGPAQ